MIKQILQKEDPALHKKCHPITKFDGSETLPAKEYRRIF